MKYGFSMLSKLIEQCNVKETGHQLGDIISDIACDCIDYDLPCQES